MNSDPEKPNPTVFISYAHEGDLSLRVRELAGWLTDKGIQVITDHPYENRPPEKGWRAWMQQNIEEADLVLMVCSERYKTLFEKREIPDEGGRGVTWEAAIITDDLYTSRLLNERFFPILPDDGDHTHVPVILRDWYNGHRFPSGNHRILSLIRDEIIIPRPAGPMQRWLTGELSGSDDPRLQPREGEILGREDELHHVLEFLRGSSQSASVCGHITGSGGIGKTEVCKVALQRWLGGDNSTRAFWVPVSDDADTRRLLAHLCEAIDLPPDTIPRMDTIDKLRPLLPAGLYYLDNLESVAESTGGIQLLRELARVPGIRLLASSRVSLDGILGKSIPIDRLDTEDGVQLFLKCWSGKPDPDPAELHRFVDEGLGGHPLSITLIARLGLAYSWETIQKLWQEQGTALARTRKPDNRMDSLEISFALTRRLLAREPGALDLWQFAALFPDGLDEKTLELWGNYSGHPRARESLAEHHILTIKGDRITMLPPIARYALGQTGSDPMDDDTFHWERTRNFAYRYFLEVSLHASEIISNDENIRARVSTSKQLRAMEQLIRTDMAWENPDLNQANQLHHQLANVYSTNITAGFELLKLFNQMLGDGLSERLLGDLEARLGNLEPARENYNQAIQLYQKEQEQLGEANTLQSLGDLETRLGNLIPARENYNQAIQLYQKEQHQLGEANTLQSLGNLETGLGNLKSARENYNKAIQLFQKEQHQLGEANTLRSLGDLERRLGNLKSARDNYDQAIQLFQKEQNQLGMANTLKSLGDLERMQGNLEPARENYNQAIQLFQKEQGQIGIANALRSLGDLERILGNLEPARENYNQAIQLYQKEQNQLGEANAYKGLGDLFLASEVIQEAIVHYQKALTIYRTVQEPMGAAYNLSDLIRCHHRSNSLSANQFQQLAKEALQSAIRSESKPVIQYVMGAILEVLDSDQEQLKAFLDSIDLDDESQDS